MTPREREQLLKDVLGGEESSPLREATLQAGLRAMRWKRRKRIGAYLSVMILPWAIVFYPAHRQAIGVKAAHTDLASKAVTPKIEKISTEELFALFPNRPVALVGKPGAQELVFLDQAQRAAGE